MLFGFAVTATMAADATEGDAMVSESLIKVVEFRLGEEQFAIEVDEVEQIVEIVEVTRLPRTPDAIHGVIDLRGEITVVIDPRSLFSVGDPIESDLEPRIIVFDLDEEPQPVGMYVDAVLAVRDYPEQAIERDETVADIDSAAIDRGLVRGVIRDDDDDRVVAWLDPLMVASESAIDRSEIGFLD